MKNYVGKKIRGFRFDANKPGWSKHMESYIGRVGEVLMQRDDYYVVVEFDDDDTWSYPISLIEPHMIEESPEIPQLGEGVFMEVSDDGVDWTLRKVVGQLQNGYFVTDSFPWKKARHIQQLPKYTHAELVDKLGHDFEYEI
jgi:hypothetical protein